MKNQFKQLLEFVEEFNTTFKVKYRKNPLVKESDYNLASLRFNLMDEENREYLQAVEDCDIVEVADALGDQMYVLLGTIMKHGLQDKIFAVVEEIHRSNMTKLQDGAPIYNSNGKIIKGSNYERPKIAEILAEPFCVHVKSKVENGKFVEVSRTKTRL